MLDFVVDDGFRHLIDIQSLWILLRNYFTVAKEILGGCTLGNCTLIDITSLTSLLILKYFHIKHKSQLRVIPESIKIT